MKAARNKETKKFDTITILFLIQIQVLLNQDWFGLKSYLDPQ